MRLNASRTTIPTNDTALEGLRQRLASWGIPPDGQQLVDGSGLSRRDVITADTLVAVLRRLHDPTSASAWMKALPIAGVDGSLQTRMKGTAAEGNVRAKTGTMSNVSSRSRSSSTTSKARERKRTRRSTLWLSGWRRSREPKPWKSQPPRRWQTNPDCVSLSARAARSRASRARHSRYPLESRSAHPLERARACRRLDRRMWPGAL